MRKTHILVLDQGTTSCRAIVFNRAGQAVSVAQKEFIQYFPQPGWVEHDAEEIWATQIGVAAEAVLKAGLDSTRLAAIGIANQRETTVLWDRHSGRPVYPAVVWQSRQSAAICEELRAEGLEGLFQEKTGLRLDAYFSGSKIRWILDRAPALQAAAERGDLLFGTIDTWLLWKLTGGRVHATDYSNASRTLLYNINTLDWDDEILSLLRIPRVCLPEVRNSSEIYATTASGLVFGQGIPIAALAGDQQAALFGHLCHQPGMAKCTYGTGCFSLMNTGAARPNSRHGLLATIAWGLNGRVTYALEGSVFVAGSLIQWLRDELRLVDTAADSEYFAGKVPDSGGVYLVPAFVGLGAPHWDMQARGAIFGLTRGVGKGHLVRAALEAICFQTYEVISAMEADAGLKLQALRVDGGMVVNNLLMRFQSDLLDNIVERPLNKEITALGAAFLAGLAVGVWDGPGDLAAGYAVETCFTPDMAADRREQLLKGWRKAVSRCRDWEDG